MGKRKPDQVITHRIELQETERATLEAALAGRFVTNAIGSVGAVFPGIGAALSPFSGVLTALGALWIADRSIDEIKETLEKVTESAVDFLWPRLDDSQDMYMVIPSWLHAQSSWHRALAQGGELRENLAEQNAWPFLQNKVREFFNHAQSLMDAGGRQWAEYSSEPAAIRWTQFYSTKAYLNDIKNYTVGGGSSGSPYNPFNWIPS